jgi:hypothetical protein
MNCKELTAVPGCLSVAGVPNRSVTIHYEYGPAVSGLAQLIATRYTEADGTPIALAAGETVSPGACAVAAPDIEWEKMCDVQADGSVVEFYHRIVTVFDAAAVPTSVVTALQLDKVTAYVVTGTVSSCDQDCDIVAPVGLVSTWG